MVGGGNFNFRQDLPFQSKFQIFHPVFGGVALQHQCAVKVLPSYEREQGSPEKFVHFIHRLNVAAIEESIFKYGLAFIQARATRPVPFRLQPEWLRIQDGMYANMLILETFFGRIQSGSKSGCIEANRWNVASVNSLDAGLKKLAVLKLKWVGEAANQMHRIIHFQVIGSLSAVNTQCYHAVITGAFQVLCLDRLEAIMNVAGCPVKEGADVAPAATAKYIAFIQSKTLRAGLQFFKTVGNLGLSDSDPKLFFLVEENVRIRVLQLQKMG